MRDRLLRFVRAIAAASFVGALCVVLTAPGSNALPAATNGPFVVLNGEGSTSLDVQTVALQNELASAKSSINFRYIPLGTQLARGDLAAKQVDFAISGVPFSADELKQVPGGASGLISAPIQVATLATFVEQAFGGFQTLQTLCNPDDPTTWPNPLPPNFDPVGSCLVKAPYKGPIRIPSRNLAAMVFHYQGAGFPSLNAWNNADVLKAFGVSSIAFLSSPNEAPNYAGRSDPDESNFYLQTFAKTAAPDVWNGNKQASPQVPWDPITERIPQVAGAVRQGVEQQLEQLAQGGCGVFFGSTCGGGVSGGLAAAPPSEIKNLRPGGRSALVFADQQPILLAQMQNANGDWVAPTPDAIDKAVDAGGTKPLFALTNKVPGAYPLVWVDNLYAPAHGLSIEKTEGMAMLIRYLATTGQKRSTAVGEGRLPTPLVSQALAAADQLVRSNCVGSGRQIVSSSDPGPLAPATATEMRSIGTMLHCQPAGGTFGQKPPASASPSSSVPGSGSSPSGANGGSSSSPFGASSLGASGAGGDNAASGSASPSSGAALASSAAGGARPGSDASSASGTSGGEAAKNNHGGLLVANQLPLPMPGGAGAGDRAATFLLGAGLFLVLRRPVTAFVRSLAR